jgi:tetratricopeptide (TPR) repeat protein
VGAPSDIERLIELGLNRYGAGDIDGALLMWEEALAIDPDNARALSYVDYVRLHYELLSERQPEVTQGEDEPFAIEEEPEYQIEITPGELPQDAPRESQPSVADVAVDAGWFDEESTHDAGSRLATQPVQHDAGSSPSIELDAGTQFELHADMPSLELEADEPPEPPRRAPSEINFEDATREYYGSPTKPAMPAGTAEAVPIVETPSDTSNSGAIEFGNEYTGGFTQDQGTPGFTTQETEIRKRDFGFVQPTAPSTGSSPTLDMEKTTERPPFAHTPREEDLLAGLPTPRPAPPPPVIDSSLLETQDIPLVAAHDELPNPKAVTREMPGSQRLPSKSTPPKNTREMPEPSRAPARRDSADLSQAEVMLSHSRTEDFNPAKIDIGAPTRDLGLRPPAPRPQLTNPDDEDAPTKQSDVRAIRQAAARDDGRVRVDTDVTDPGRGPQLDPIEAAAAEILDEVDAAAPADETPDDQTRRRINALLERAVAWSSAGEVERAVAAVDLALNEDPNSALAQKLLTRHRDAITGVFQSYLGDLERMPQLARPLHELQDAPINPRAAFLLSRIDGTLTIDELLDVSGMPRLEAYRHICQLYLRGILR